MLSFDGDEENLIESVISILDAGREKFTFQEIKLKPELQHKGIVIDLERREVIRNDEKVELTYCFINGCFNTMDFCDCHI